MNISYLSLNMDIFSFFMESKYIPDVKSNMDSGNLLQVYHFQT
jgi:hypothetical protein